MPLPTFNPPLSPSPGMQDKPEVRIVKADFGGGYTQSTADGINHIRRVVSATWDVLDLDERNEILAFFRARGGFQPFYWTPLRDLKPTKWTVEDWSDTAISGGFYSISATFRQSFTMTV